MFFKKSAPPTFEEKREAFRGALNDLIEKSGMNDRACAKVLENWVSECRLAWVFSAPLGERFN